MDWDSFKTVNPHAEFRPELKEKIQKWILSFYHLDPRYKILTFFNLVASEGADNVTDDSQDEQLFSMGSSTRSAVNGSGRSSSVESSMSSGSSEQIVRSNAPIMQRPSARRIRPSTLSLLSSLFNATSILTVWRPCSNDAMRKMMEGTGVGKGLDIKGKSAKRGILSAFVPFMQIYNNEHKGEIQPIAEFAEMRVYYKDRELRDYVYKVLEEFRRSGPSKKNGGEFAPSTRIDEVDEDDWSVIGDNDVEDEDRLPPHKDPDSPSYIPDNAKLKIWKRNEKSGFYGIECSQRLFWYATIQDADISREGTGTETGRQSLPGFQDANHKTLKVAQAQLPKPKPMPVVLQHKTLADVKKDFAMKEEKKLDDSEGGHELESCLDPRWLVMAYEEQKTVKPVVSDFDGFLLGWRREALWFGCLLPRDQEALMMWCVDNIEKILDDQKSNPTNSDTWTIRWLDVMKSAAADGYHVDVPEYGFGDPKSTSIMEHAAKKLISTGAVRHGSECFNYNFPQEIDDMFLLISDTLKPVPWKYVNVKDLQTILSQKIREGFVFPLNPKWILCDPGWKKIYDELMASEALYADLSKDVWFPPHTGIRDRIEQIHARHPNGFQRCTDASINRKLSHEKSSRTGVSGRRQSATNILRDTLDDGLGSELTGNAFADLAQLELEDFVGRTSVYQPKKSTSIIKEGENEDGITTFNGSGKQEKRPSTVSHTSIASSQSGVASASNSGRGLEIDKRGISSGGASTTSTQSIQRRGLRSISKAVQSTRKLIAPSKSKSRSRGRRAPSIDEHDSASAPISRSPISDFPKKPSASKTRYLSAPQPTRYGLEPFGEGEDDKSTPLGKADPKEKMEEVKKMNATFSKWNKIKKNLNKNSKNSKH